MNPKDTTTTTKKEFTGGHETVTADKKNIVLTFYNYKLLHEKLKEYYEDGYKISHSATLPKTDGDVEQKLFILEK